VTNENLGNLNKKSGAGKISKLIPVAFDFVERRLRKPAPAKPSKKRALADFSDNNMESQ
jgi:hypothetical protein